MKMKECNKDYNELKIQTIKRKVDPALLSGKYYRQVINDIKRKINDDTELLLIQITTKEPISKQWILESFLHLQRELTSVIIVPENTVNMKKEEFEEFERMFNCTIYYI